MNEQLTLKASQLSVNYGRQQALKSLDFCAKPGDLTVLVGPNGCGKSTLLKALARVHSPVSGQVLLGDKPLKDLKNRVIAQKMAYLPQGPVAPEGVRVRDLVAQGRYPHQGFLKQWSEEDEQWVEWAMTQTALHPLADKDMLALSGGQQQRAWIAMTLAQNTPVLLLDEPTAFLDLNVQVTLLSLLKHVAHQSQRTIVVVLHDLNLAASFADHMVMMKQGQVVAKGEVKDVYTRENLESTFGLSSVILTDPLTQRPLCVPKHIDLSVDGL